MQSWCENEPHSPHSIIASLDSAHVCACCCCSFVIASIAVALEDDDVASFAIVTVLVDESAWTMDACSLFGTSSLDAIGTHDARVDFSSATTSRSTGCCWCWCWCGLYSLEVAEESATDEAACGWVCIWWRWNEAFIIWDTGDVTPWEVNTCLLSLSVDVDSALFVDGVASAFDRDEEDLVVVDSSVGWTNCWLSLTVLLALVVTEGVFDWGTAVGCTLVAVALPQLFDGLMRSEDDEDDDEFEFDSDEQSAVLRADSMRYCERKIIWIIDEKHRMRRIQQQQKKPT